MKKKILFVTGTRADFGKMKTIIKEVKNNKNFTTFIVVTGMHMLPQFGSTYQEVEKSFKLNVIKFKNQKFGESMENILTKTINRFSKIVKKINPDLIVFHGDRVETLACSIVGSMNHILTAHLEGGEISGSIDDSIRHAVTKLSHTHFVGNLKAQQRILRMGEIKKNTFVVGSADNDIILTKKLPNLNYVKKHYDIKFNEYAILLWHPVTSELASLKSTTVKLINFINMIKTNFVVIYSNNDPGTNIIISTYKNLLNKNNFKLLKSMRFENFLSLLKNAKFILGNSSSGIYEAPILGTPCFNIGSRQNKRIKSQAIKDLNINQMNELSIINFLKKYKKIKYHNFGTGKTSKKFIKIISNKNFWQISRQKFFEDKQ